VRSPLPPTGRRYIVLSFKESKRYNPQQGSGVCCDSIGEGLVFVFGKSRWFVVFVGLIVNNGRMSVVRKVSVQETVQNSTLVLPSKEKISMKSEKFTNFYLEKKETGLFLTLKLRKAALNATKNSTTFYKPHSTKFIP